MNKIILTIATIFLLAVSSRSQEVIHDKIYNNNIKTVLMYLGDNDLSLPVWDLNSSKSLKLSFDEITTESRDYYYTIIHCNSDWTPSDLDPSEYIEGYFEDRISEYQSSFNTNVNYIHYTLQIPNEYMKPTISGNYIVKVYNGLNPDEIAFTKRFMVAERKTDIKTSFRHMNQTSFFQKDQEPEVIVKYFENEIYDLDQNIELQVLKNRDWNSVIIIDRPDYIRDNEYTYNNYTKLKFPGGNEFHHFNTKNVHHQSENIMNISFVDNRYHFQIAQNTDRTFTDYLYKPDINGKFKVDVNPGSEYAETEADYVYVYFSLKMDVPLQLGDIYVWGQLSNYDFTSENKMRYNFEQKAYESRMFLKQGYYNYQYVLMENNTPNYTYIEGNHVQTENDYLILVYYHDFHLDSDRLIGVSEFNTRPE